MKIQLSNGQKDAIRAKTDSILRSRLRGWLRRWGTSETAVQRMMQEMIVGLWMTFHKDLPNDLVPFKKKGVQVGDMTEISGLQLMSIQAFNVLDDKLAWVEANKHRWIPEKRVIWHAEPPKLDGVYTPRVARRVDLEVGSMRSEFMQTVTNTRYVVNQDTLRDILAYRESLSREKANSIMYEREADVFGDLEFNSTGDMALFESLSGVSDPGCIALDSQDEAGRFYAEFGPMYSRFLRAAMGHEWEALTEEGAFMFRKYLADKYGKKDDLELDNWSKSIDENGLQVLVNHHKKGADMLSDARGWKEFRQTGGTCLPAKRDYIAQGLGIIAALQGASSHRQLVDTAHPDHRSAHAIFSDDLRAMFRSLRGYTAEELKPISKNCLLPGPYGGGKLAIAAKQSDMEWDAVAGDWNYGEDGDRVPDIHPLLESLLPQGDVRAKMEALVKESSKMARLMHKRFPFLKPFQERVVANWHSHSARGECPIFEYKSGYRLPAAPIRMNKKWTTHIRGYKVLADGSKIRPGVTVFKHDLNEDGTDWMAKSAFRRDSDIVCHTGLMLAEAGVKNQDHVHDMHRVGWNHVTLLDRVSVEAYNVVCGTDLPADAKLLASD